MSIYIVTIVGKLKYQAQSPDESALVSAARNFGVVFIERTPNSVTIETMGVIKVHELLCILDFNNTRRRMSVVFRENGKIRLYCKGADSVIFDRLEPGNEEYKAMTLQHLNVSNVKMNQWHVYKSVLIGICRRRVTHIVLCS